MASMTEELEKAQATHDAILRLVCALPDPPHLGSSKCQPVSYDCFRALASPHASSRALLSDVQAGWSDCKKAFQEDNADEVAGACGELRPKLERLACAAHKAARSDLEDHLTGNATCAWASVLENDAKAVWISGGSGGHRGVSKRDRCVESVALDVIAVTAREAKALEKSARHLATKPGYPPIGDCKRACAKLRKAAGLWESLSHAGDRTPIALLDALPENCGMTFEKRPPEATRACCAGAALLASASAQRCAIASALAQNKLPDSLAAKLCGGVAEKLEAARNASRDGAPKHHARLDRAAANSAASDANLFRGLRAYFCAREAKAKEEHGVCVAWYRDAEARLAPAIVSTSGAGADRPRDLDALKKALQVARAAADHENSRIYYETVPAPKELRAPPAVKTMGPEAPLCLIADAEPVPLSAPTADDEALARQLAASFEEEGSSHPPPPAYEAAPPAALSDEELARRLHEELNG